MAEKTIMLVCSAGMSTSLLVTKMQAASKARNLDTEIFAISAASVDENIANKKIDVMLLGPQVRFMKGQFEKKLAGKNIPLDIINMQDYGRMNGENVLNQALELIKE